MSRIFKAAAIQMRAGATPEDNAAVLDRMVRDAAAQGATYVQTPEMTGMVQRDRKSLQEKVRRPEEDAIVSTAGNLARELGITLHIGSAAVVNETGSVANRAFVFAPDGSLVTSYDKIHAYDVDLPNGESWRESAIYTPGSTCIVADLPMARFGIAICYDLRFPHLFRDQALAGAIVLTVPSAFTRQTGLAHWHVLLRARAIENGAWVIAAAQGGVHEDGRETFGHTIIIDPWGKIVAEADHDEPAIIVADIDPAASEGARQQIPNLKNARDYSLRVITDEMAKRQAS
jgi:predicted amidohydrolase